MSIIVQILHPMKYQINYSLAWLIVYLIGLGTFLMSAFRHIMHYTSDMSPIWIDVRFKAIIKTAVTSHSILRIAIIHQRDQTSCYTWQLRVQLSDTHHTTRTADVTYIWTNASVIPPWQYSVAGHCDLYL